VTTQLTGHHNYTGQAGQANGGVGGRALDISPDGTQAVVIGNFKQADGVLHDQIVRLNLGASATLNTGWNTSGYTAPCVPTAFDTYMRDVQFAPDGSYFAIAATGGGTMTLNTDGTRGLCDTATRWNTSSTGTSARPAWISYTGQDTLESVAVTGTAIYIGGHDRWMNNSKGVDSAGPGAVPRPGIAALDPINGMPYAWNPGRNPRGSGAWALLATANGLYVGSDTDKIGVGATLTTRGRIAFFPLAGGESVPQYAPPSLPTTVYMGGQLTPQANSPILYRVNAGGPALASNDSGPAWESDLVNPGPYRIAGSGEMTSTWTQVPALNASVPATTPIGIFSSERWDAGVRGDGHEMSWIFAIPASTKITVRLYFANRYAGTSTVGKKKFDVKVNGTQVLTNYDIVADTGNNKGTMKAFSTTVNATGTVTVTFVHSVQNPSINGIEILNNSTVTPPTGAFDTLRTRTFTGTSAGSATTLSTAIQWSKVRGAFMVGSTLYYGFSDGKFYKATWNGTAFVSPTYVDPYEDPLWSNVDTGSGQTFKGMISDYYGVQVQSTTGSFFNNGEMYYSLYGDPVLHYRHFEPDDGVIGDEFLAGGDESFLNAQGMFLSGNTLYWADRTNGNLHAVAWNNGAPSAASDTVVSGPVEDGVDWRARSLFTMPPPAPTAVFTSSCTALACSFDASASTAPGASITSYSWSFGDGATGTGVSPNHTYAVAGSYTVSLTITSSLGTSAIITHAVAPFIPQANNISFVNGTHIDGNATSLTVNVPAEVQQNDGMLFVSVSGQPAITVPAGWTLVGTSPAAFTSFTTSVYRRVAGASDAGTAVAASWGTTTMKASVQLLAYRGTNTSNFVSSATMASAASGTTIDSPTLTVPANEWAVTYFGAKSSVVTGWTIGGGQTSRDVDNGTGSGRINSVVLDSNGVVPPGSVGGYTGTTDQAFGGAAAWTIILTS